MVKKIDRLTTGAPNRAAIQLEDKLLWQIFNGDFRNVFTNSQKQLSAHQKFLKVKCKGTPWMNILQNLNTCVARPVGQQMILAQSPSSDVDSTLGF